MADTGTPSQTADLVAELDHIRARATALMARVPDDGACGWQPDGGRGWSVAQCLDHLTRTNALYLATMRPAVARVPRSGTPVTAPLQSSWAGRRFIRSLEPGTMKMPAPGAFAPASDIPRETAWRGFQDSLDEIERLMRDAAGVDLNRAVFPNPLFKLIRMRASTGLRGMLAHMRRHIAQAERVADARDAHDARSA